MRSTLLKTLSYFLKAIRRALIVVLGFAISLWVDLAHRWGLLFWPFFTEALGMIPFTFGWQLRQDVYRRLGLCKGEGVIINHRTSIGERATTIGSDVWISKGVYVEYAHIGNHVLIGPSAVLLAGRYHHRAEGTEVPIKVQGNNPLEPIAVGDGAWIGANATVMADVGRHAIVGAGSVVLKAVPDYGVVAGNPARFIRDRRDRVGKSEAPLEMKSAVEQEDISATREKNVHLMKTD